MSSRFLWEFFDSVNNKCTTSTFLSQSVLSNHYNIDIARSSKLIFSSVSLFYYVFPSIPLTLLYLSWISVKPSVSHKSCPLYIYISNPAGRIFMKLWSGVHLIKTMCRNLHVPTVLVWGKGHARRSNMVFGETSVFVSIIIFTRNFLLHKTLST